MASIPVPLSTAVYAIQESARLEADELILVCCGSNTDAGADLASVRIAQLTGAQVFAVSPSEENQDRLIHDLGLPRDHVLAASDQDLSGALLKATGHRAFDVIVAFTDEQLPTLASLGATCADCARLVQVGVGGQALVEALALDPTLLRKNVTYTTLEIGSIIGLETPSLEKLRRRYVHFLLPISSLLLCHWAVPSALSRSMGRTNHLLRRLFAKAISLYRQGDLKALGFTPDIYDISAVGEALHAVASTKIGSEGDRRRWGVVVSLENDASTLPVRPVKYDTVFSPDKTYLLVGCLGGLGRSISRWMLARGGRKFVFLGRSGTDKAPARRMVEDLQASGAEVTVVRGDVVNLEDVERAVRSIEGLIGGVIQAAMGLGVSIVFLSLSSYTPSIPAPGTYHIQQ